MPTSPRRRGRTITYKVFVILAREYRTQIKSKAFIISLVLMPVLMGGSLAIQTAMREKVNLNDQRIAVIDHTGMIYAQLAAQAEQRNKLATYDEEGQQIGPRFILERVEPQPDRQQHRLALSDRVRDQQLFAFVEIGARVFDGPPSVEQGKVRYYSNSPTELAFKQWLTGALNQLVQAQRFKEADLPPEAVHKATRPVILENLGLVSVTETGQVKDAERSDELAAFLVPFGFMMLMFVGVMVGATPLLQSIIEEKMQRIAEVLLGSVSPFQLMLGKLLGVVAVSLTMIGVYLVGAYGVAYYFEKTDLIPADRIGWLLAYSALAVLMFGSMFCAVGASCSEIKDAQSLMTPIMIIVVSPLFFLEPILRSPSGTLATGLSLFPPATPMLMIVRMSVPPGIPLWQPIVGIIGVIGFTVLSVFAASRIFRVGILMQGKTPKLADLIKWAIRG